MMVRVVLLFALAAASAASVDLSAVAQSVQAKGLALPANFIKQWTALLSKANKDFTALEAAQIQAQPAATKQAVTAAIADLQKRVAKVNSDGLGVAVFQEKQNRQLTKIVGDYVDLINQRIKGKGNTTSEASVLALRANKQAVLLGWEQELEVIAAESRAMIVDTFKAAMENADPETRKALDAVLSKLLQQEVHAQIEVISLVTTLQSTDVQRFVVQAEGLVMHFIAAAQAAALRK